MSNKIYFRSNSSFKNRLSRLFWFVIAMTIRPFVTIKKKQLICWSYYGTQYSCNPRYLTEHILENHIDDFQIYWVLSKMVKTSGIDKRVHIVHPHSLKYILKLYSSEFVITNCRTNQYVDFFKKKRHQKYIMTWHGTTPLKKIEKDAGDDLPVKYQKNAIRDSKMCDLMLSNCKYFSDIIRRAFWYNGEILERGIPRNDIYFDINKYSTLIKKIFKDNHILENTLILLYAPTFRNDNCSSHFKINWNSMACALEEKTKKPVRILLRLHPNSIGVVNVNELLADPNVIDMCSYPDMQELLLVSDMLITDYSSTMFEMGLQRKPCILYTPDLTTYDRDFYFDIHSLPFPLAETEDELRKLIVDFDNDKYQSQLVEFNDGHLKIYDSGHASEAVCEWMKNKSV